jgi:hypothetical protein
MEPVHRRMDMDGILFSRKEKKELRGIGSLRRSIVSTRACHTDGRRLTAQASLVDIKP